ncbi:MULTISPECIES: hypothetical protein [Enterobacter]|uniref:hypothetical protein n=1 Tax=Enterobacter TaxID=547 RepID=UPI00321687D9|nr:hypothetical protein [Enterobacter hormaechei subsp. xiangfangensis]
MQNQNTPAQEKHTVYLFNAEHADKTAAKQAGKLFTLDIEHPMTLNDLSLLCESVADAVGAPGGIKYAITTEPNGVQEEY